MISSYTLESRQYFYCHRCNFKSRAINGFCILPVRCNWNKLLLGFIVIILVSVVISGFVDNVPYIIVMLPVVATIPTGMGLSPELYMFALLIDSCLGGNLTPFGASANVVAIGILKKQGITVTFIDWLKIGLPFTLITTITSSVVLWFIWR